MVAKIASDVAKPDGLLEVPSGRVAEFMAPLPVGCLWGVGPVTLGLLKEHGIGVIGDLAAAEEPWLQSVLGRRGLELRDRALGIDRSQVHTHRDAKSVSAETTMAEDVADRETLIDILEGQIASVIEHLRRRSRRGKTVRLKLRLADFTTFTRQRTLDVPTDDASLVLDVARALLDAEMRPGRRFRLIGVGLANLQTEDEWEGAQVVEAVQRSFLPSDCPHSFRYDWATISARPSLWVWPHIKGSSQP
jgi:DNA polymerase-4